MSAIEGSVSGFKDRVDGTLVLTIEIEPRHASEALALFRVRGTAVALAALKPAHLDDSDKPDQQSEPVGPLAKWLIMRCKEPQFWEWLGSGGAPKPTSEQAASELAKEFLGIQSRKEIDLDPDKTERFHRLIRGPYSKWLAARG